MISRNLLYDSNKRRVAIIIFSFMFACVMAAIVVVLMSICHSFDSIRK
jgi:hypothetical protein